MSEPSGRAPPRTYQLPLRFDPRRLQAEVDALAPSEWVPHFNSGYYEREWSGVALRSVGGRPAQLYPDPTAAGAYADTEVLSRCPYLAGVLAAFRCPLTAVRLLKLGVGARIREHRDYRLGYEDGEVRLHVPVRTHPDVDFFLAGERVVLREGECWYLDFNQPHRLENRSAVDRVHLVLDCVVDDWLRAQLGVLPADPGPGPAIP